MTNKTVPHQGGVSTTPPVEGQPFNFNSLLSGVLVPSAIMRFPQLAPGAKLLWGIVRNHSRKSGVCWTRNRILARTLNCSVRQVKRYRRQLARVKLMRLVSQSGDTWGCVLLWHPHFGGAMGVGRVTCGLGVGPDMARGRVTYVPPIQSGVFMENSSGGSSSSSMVGFPQTTTMLPHLPVGFPHWSEFSSRSDHLIAAIKYTTGAQPALELPASLLNILGWKPDSLEQLIGHVAVTWRKLGARPGFGYWVHIAQQLATGQLRPAVVDAMNTQQTPAQASCPHCGAVGGRPHTQVALMADGSLFDVDEWIKAGQPDWSDRVKFTTCPANTTSAVPSPSARARG